jgi:hypothetical protein
MEKIDNFVIFFSKSIVLLKKYKETNQKKYTHIFQKLMQVLLKRKKFAMDQDLWEELYYYSIYLYPYEKKIHSIPVTFVTKHNEILAFYMKQRIHRLPYTILRFDTHSDLNGIKHSLKLPQLYKRYLDTKDASCIDKAQKIVWDIGAAKSGVLLTTGLKDVVWGMPKWIPERQCGVPFFIKKTKTQYKLATTMVDGCDTDFSYSKNKYDAETKTYTKLQTGKWTKKTVQKIREQIEKNGDTYILDIDLDYFICNGSKSTHSYKELYNDLQSHGRTEKIIFNQDTPRNTLEKSSQLTYYQRQLYREIKKVNRRIYLFLKLLKAVKYKPCLISICDSTNILFQECTGCNTIGNGYVPTHLALYVHQKIVDGLKNIL